MSIKKANILIVDDDADNRFLLGTYLENAGYNQFSAHDGKEAWEFLLKKNVAISAILLDRNMPKMDGMEFLKLIKSENDFEDIPVIMQTGVTDKSAVRQGIREGAYYYLIKPFREQTVLSIVNAAVTDFKKYKILCHQANKTRLTASSISNASFMIKTPEEADSLSAFLASAYPRPDEIVSGISELLLNAIEHGNLGISYFEKTALCKSDDISSEINKRLLLEKNASKNVNVNFYKTADMIKLTIIDDGDGFDWKPYINLTPDRVCDNHGRGIALAALSFSEIIYSDKGNEVTCILNI